MESSFGPARQRPVSFLPGGETGLGPLRVSPYLQGLYVF